MQQTAFEWTPLVARHPHLAAAGIIHRHRQPADRRIIGGRLGRDVRATHKAVKSAFFYQIHAARRRPVALIVAISQRITITATHAVGRTHARGVIAEGRTIFRNFQHAALVFAI